MYDTVQSVILKHQATWNSNPAFADAYNAFAAKLDGLKDLSTEHINSTKGATALKLEVQEKAVNQALTLGNVLGALALKIGDTELLMRNIYTHSEWLKGSSLMKMNRFKNLLSDTMDHEQALLEYGIDNAFIQDFEANILQFEMLSKQTRTSIVSRKQMTEAIANYFSEIDELLDGQVGRIILVFGQTDPKFVRIFKNARIVVDHKGKRNNYKGRVVPKEPDDDDELPINNF